MVVYVSWIDRRTDARWVHIGSAELRAGRSRWRLPAHAIPCRELADAKSCTVSLSLQKLKLNSDFMLSISDVTSPASTSRLPCTPDSVRATLPAV